jgi:hypothetical protein
MVLLMKAVFIIQNVLYVYIYNFKLIFSYYKLACLIDFDFVLSLLTILKKKLHNDIDTITR